MGKLKVSGTKKSKTKYYINDNPRDINGNPLPKVPAMVSACVSFYRKKAMPLKTIYLCPVYYHQFCDWFRRLCVEMEADIKSDLLTFDGVEIEMMENKHIQRSQHGTDEFDYDFYPMKPQGNA